MFTIINQNILLMPTKVFNAFSPYNNNSKFYITCWTSVV